MRQLQLIAHGEPSDVIELNTVSEAALGQEDVLISMEAAPLNPSDFLFVRGIYGVRPAFPSSVGAEGVGRVAKIGSKVDVALRGKRVLIIPTYEQGTWADQVVAPVSNLAPMSDQKLGDLVADGSLSAAVEHVYPLDQSKEAFRQSLKSNRSGKILFQF